MAIEQFRRRLATKLLNASKFVLSFPAPEAGAEVTEPLDIAMLDVLSGVVTAATAALSDFEYTTALERIERFFWTFCRGVAEPRHHGRHGFPHPVGDPHRVGRQRDRRGAQGEERSRAGHRPAEELRVLEPRWRRSRPVREPQRFWHRDTVHNGRRWSAGPADDRGRPRHHLARTPGAESSHDTIAKTTDAA